jgi:hypothetical protein
MKNGKSRQSALREILTLKKLNDAALACCVDSYTEALRAVKL